MRDKPHASDAAVPLGTMLDVEIAAIGAQGDGVAESALGRVFVPYTVPGDRLSVRILGKKGEGYLAEAVEFHVQGAARQVPPCRHFGVCGACALQHLSDDAYRAWKRDQVVQALSMQHLDTTVIGDLIATPSRSRRRLRLLAKKQRDAVVLGFAERGSHRAVDVMDCPIAHPALSALLPKLRQIVHLALANGEAGEVAVSEIGARIDVVLRTPSAPDARARAELARLAHDGGIARLSWQGGGKDRRSRLGPPETIAQFGPVQASLFDVAVDVPPEPFLQPSKEGEAAIVAEVVAALNDARRMADLYCGCGTLTFALARRRVSVTACDSDGAMIAALAAAARRAGLDGRVSASVRDLDRQPLTRQELSKLDAVVLDPPRQGAALQVREIAAAQVPLLVYVSCNPTTFARDTRILVDQGYRLIRVIPIDQFLWSAHVELVAVLER